QRCGLDAGATNEPGDGMEHHRVLDLFFLQAFQDLKMKRASFVVVTFVQIKSDLDGGDGHRPDSTHKHLAVAIPSNVAPRQRKLESRTLAAKSRYCPSWNSAIDSNAKEEKVVYPPQKPTAMNQRQRKSASTRSDVQIMKNPSTSEPVT